jgi:hypothetical protein
MTAEFKHQIEDLYQPVGFPVEQLAADDFSQLYEGHLKVRRRLLDYCMNEFGLNDAKTLTQSIFNEIAPVVDRLFITIYKSKSDVDGPSWRSFDEVACDSLRIKIGEIQIARKYTRYLKNATFLNQTLSILKDELLTETPVQAQTVLKLEKLATEAIAAGKPAILICLDSVYKKGVYDPDLRLIWPLPEDEYVRTSRIVSAAWQKIASDIGIKSGQPDVLLGNYIAGSGIQLLSFTTGERFLNGGFVLCSNIFKYESLRQTLCESWGRLEPGNTHEYLALLFALHEFGHSIFFSEVPLFNELRVDLPMFLYGLEILLENKIPEFNLIDFLVAIVAEYQGQLDAAGGGGIYEAGYKLSSLVLLNLLSGTVDLGKEPKVTEIKAQELLEKIEHLNRWLSCQTTDALRSFEPKNLPELAQSLIDKGAAF